MSVVSVVVMSVRGAVPDPRRTLSFTSVACLCRGVGFASASGLALTAVVRPRHVASHDNTDIKTRANTPSKSSRFSGIQYYVYTLVGNWSKTANLLLRGLSKYSDHLDLPTALER